MSVIRTFTVTVGNPGSGNRYYIDGVLQETVNLAEGYTYKFDVSDSSVSGHPFKFSTTSNGTHSGGSEYTTGVTTSGNAGDNGAYVQIVVAASAPQLYYYCQYHSGMGGSANTVDSDTWGVLEWGQNNWGSQDGVPVLLTGLSVTTTLGEFPYAQATNGWGGDAWGDNNWGENEITVSLAGLGLTATSSLPSVGWGNQVFGSDNEGWGGIYQLPVADVMGLTGLSVDADLGTATAKSDFSTELTGISLQSSLGLVSSDDHSVGLSGFEIDVDLGTATTTQLSIAALTGLDLNTDLGAVTISSNPIVLPGSLTAQTALGSLTVDDTTMGLTGLSAQTALGALTTTQLTIASLVDLGLTATTTLNDAGIRLKYYETLTPKDSSGYTTKTPKNTTGYTIKEAL